MQPILWHVWVIVVGLEYSVGVRLGDCCRHGVSGRCPWSLVCTLVSMVCHWCHLCLFVSMVLLGYLAICTSKKAMPPLLSTSFVNFISGNTWLMHEVKVFTSVRFNVAKVSYT